MANAIAVRQLSKSFSGGTRALSAVDFTIAPGEMVALIGASGSGKSTLLRHISGFIGGDRGTGAVEVFGRQAQAGGRIARDIRDIRAGIGFVFQQFNLVNRLSVLANVAAGGLHRMKPWRSLSMRFSKAEIAAALDALRAVGIAETAWQRAATLSGGQQQRAAVARALVQGARIILADEPIASLDPESARKVMDILAELNRSRGLTVLVSLHQVETALRYCPRVIALHAGAVVYDGPAAALTPAVLRRLYGASAEELLATDHLSLVNETSGPGHRTLAAVG